MNKIGLSIRDALHSLGGQMFAKTILKVGGKPQK